jgi:hypothetical protein
LICCPCSTESPFTDFTAKNENGRDFDVRVHPQSLIYHIKSSIESDHDIPLLNQEVCLDGKPLQNGRKLKYYGINSASRLTFHLRDDSADHKARKADLNAKWGRVQTTGRDAMQIFCRTLTGYVGTDWFYHLWHPQTTLTHSSRVLALTGIPALAQQNNNPRCRAIRPRRILEGLDSGQRRRSSPRAEALVSGPTIRRRTNSDGLGHLERCYHPLS